jgi:hypothetical protein
MALIRVGDEHYFFKKIFGCHLRQVHDALNDFRYAMRVVGQMEPGNDA